MGKACAGRQNPRLGSSFREEARIRTYLVFDAGAATLADDRREGLPNVMRSRASGSLGKSSIVPCGTAGRKITEARDSFRNRHGQHKSEKNSKNCRSEEGQPGIEPEGRCGAGDNRECYKGGARRRELKGRQLEFRCSRQTSEPPLSLESRKNGPQIGFGLYAAHMPRTTQRVPQPEKCQSGRASEPPRFGHGQLGRNGFEELPDRFELQSLLSGDSDAERFLDIANQGNIVAVSDQI
jgi:hypothetical protein